MMKFQNTAILSIALVLSACGGGSGGSANSGGATVGANAGTVSGQGCTNKFGRTWTAVDGVGQKLEYFNNVVYGNGVFLGIGYGKAVISRDGENWVNVTSSGVHGGYALTYALGKIYMVGQAGGLTDKRMMASSTIDGTSWDNLIIGDSANPSLQALPYFDPKSMSYGNGRFILVGGDGKIIWSADGRNWYAAANAADLKVYVFGWSTFANGKFYAGAGLNVYVSSDGNTWQTQKIVGDGTFPTTGITGMQYFNGMYVAVDSQGNIANSSDGVNWKTVAKGRAFLPVNGNAIVAGGGQLMAVDLASSFTTDGDYIFYSCDGIQWEKTKVPNGNYSYSIAIGDNIAAGVGNTPIFSKY
ncbi:hypothetical protein ACO0LM_25090 [Undibacterium sp. Di26W]|uniref:hypothetical protein n=1 Tax=Undibacterium sp. Di26W TaxID=3413035 RepID=UPI003BF34E8E